MSTSHVSPDLDLYLLNLYQVLVIRYVSPFPYDLGSPHIDHGGNMLAKHVSPDLDLNFIIYLF